MVTIQQVQEEIINEFIVFDDWMDRYNYLIELSNELPAIDPKLKNNDYLIRGCQSKVWLNAEYNDGRIIYTADSDAIITKGIIALLIRVLSNRTPQEIVNANLEFIETIGLRHGLLSMIKQMKLYALAYDAKEKKN